MSASIVVGDHCIHSSTGAIEALRVALAGVVPAGAEASPAQTRLIDALENRWPAYFDLGREPYTGAEEQQMLVAATLALVEDALSERPRLVAESDWCLDGDGRFRWAELVLRFAYALTDVDHSGDPPRSWSQAERLQLGVVVAE